MIGHVVPAYCHVHVSELDAACGWIDPVRPTGPLHVAENTEPPSIGPLSAFAANAAAFRRFATATNPALEVAAIRAYLAPLSDRHAHLSRMKLIFDGSTLLEPARRGTTIWHIWAIGTTASAPRGAPRS